MAATPKAIYASLPKVTRGKVTLLKGDPKGKNFLYSNGKNVFIRDIENPLEVDVYTQHAKEATVAVYAPSGFYICSGDITGKVRIWDTTQAEHLLKYEYTPISGAIKDIAWSPDSKRIVVVGEGRETFAKVFLWDSGSTVGNCDGHGAVINAVDYKTTRPFRICSASEDRTVGFFEGPPFKRKRLNSDFTNFVNCVEFSPDGNFFIAGSAGGKLILYDGKEGEQLAELSDDAAKGKAHAGGIYGLSWSADSSSVLTASADRTCKIWDIANKSVETTFNMSDERKSVDDQQLGCLWQGDHLLSVSLSGNINYLDKKNPSTPLRVIKGHHKNITSVAASNERRKIYTASFDARLASWTDAGQASYFKGAGHKNQVTMMHVVGDELVTCSWDNTLRFTSLDTEEFGADSIGVDSQPSGFGPGKDGLIILTLEKEVVVIRNKKVVHTMKTHYEATGASVHIGQTEVAVGAKDGSVYIYTLDNDILEEKKKIDIRGDVTVLSYSPDGGCLAVGTSSKEVLCYQKSDYKEISKYWSYLTSKITCLAWSPDSRHVAAGSIDTNICIYSPDKPNAKLLIKAAHPTSVVTGVTWYDENTLVSVGQDCNVRLWNVTPL